MSSVKSIAHSSPHDPRARPETMSAGIQIFSIQPLDGPRARRECSQERLGEKQKAIQEEAFRITPLEPLPCGEPVATNLIHDDLPTRMEKLLNPVSNRPIFPTPLMSTSQDVDRPRPENVDRLLKRIEELNPNTLCHPLPVEVARRFVARQKTDHHLYPPSKPIIIAYQDEIDFFHVPWMLLYSIVQIEFSLGYPAFFNQSFLMESLVFPPLISPVIPDHVPGREEYIVTLRPQAWSTVEQNLDVLANTVYNRRKHEWRGKQVQNFFTTATRLIRQEFPEQIREGIALRIRLSSPFEYPSATPSYFSLKSAMEANKPLSLPDFEVVRCLHLGDLSDKLMVDISTYLRKHSQGWFLADKLISSVDKKAMYSPTGAVVSLTFGEPIPTTTRKITQMLDSFVQGDGFTVHTELEYLKRRLDEELHNEDPSKRIRLQEISYPSTEDTSFDTSVSILDLELKQENIMLRHQLKTITTEKKGLLNKILELEQRTRAEPVDREVQDTLLTDRTSLLTQLEQAKVQHRELMKRNNELSIELEKAKDNVIQTATEMTKILNASVRKIPR
ncbi:hypothetical protein GGR50DRAFT_697959 [Xylaria sp. CBS 124048]|nr:hypothetical protein GGR50DRAFT_697959 [Xylaria sp. CBS 124048]